MALRTRHFDPLAPVPTECLVVALGDFETLSLSDQALLDAAAREAAALSVPLMAVSVRSDEPSIVLSSADRDVLLGALGVDAAVLVPLDERVRTMPAESFVDRLLLKVARPQVLFVLRDFRFGLENSGDAETLRAYGLRRDFEVKPVSVAEVGGQPVTARRVRDAVIAANPALVEQLTGRAWHRPVEAQPAPAAASMHTADATEVPDARAFDSLPEADTQAPQTAVDANAEDERTPGHHEPDTAAYEEDEDDGAIEDAEYLDDGTPVVSDPYALAAAEAAVAGVSEGKSMRLPKPSLWHSGFDSADDEEDAPDAESQLERRSIPPGIPVVPLLVLGFLVLAAIARGCSGL